MSLVNLAAAATNSTQNKCSSSKFCPKECCKRGPLCCCTTSCTQQLFRIGKLHWATLALLLKRHHHKVAGLCLGWLPAHAKNALNLPPGSWADHLPCSHEWVTCFCQLLLDQSLGAVRQDIMLQTQCASWGWCMGAWILAAHLC